MEEADNNYFTGVVRSMSVRTVANVQLGGPDIDEEELTRRLNVDFPVAIVFIVVVHSFILYTAFVAYEKLRNRYEIVIMVFFWMTSVTHYIHEAHDKIINGFRGEHMVFTHWGIQTSGWRRVLMFMFGYLLVCVILHLMMLPRPHWHEGLQTGFFILYLVCYQSKSLGDWNGLFLPILLAMSLLLGKILVFCKKENDGVVPEALNVKKIFTAFFLWMFSFLMFAIQDLFEPNVMIDTRDKSVSIIRPFHHLFAISCFVAGVYSVSILVAAVEEESVKKYGVGVGPTNRNNRRRTPRRRRMDQPESSTIISAPINDFLTKPNPNTTTFNINNDDVYESRPSGSPDEGVPIGLPNNDESAHQPSYSGRSQGSFMEANTRVSHAPTFTVRDDDPPPPTPVQNNKNNAAPARGVQEYDTSDE